MGRGGFRIDRQASCCDTLTMQGDYYNGDAGLFQTLPTPGAPFVQTGPQQRSMVGGNALLRWTHQIDDESDWSLQAYYDRTERTFHAADFREYRDTVDVDFQHRFHWNDRNSIIWGFGYRNSRDQIRNTPFHLQFLPPDRSDDRFSTFVQDEVTLCDDLLFFTVGSKFSWNDYTGFEIQPTARLLYTPTKRQSVWASVSRAVRVPSRASDDARLITAPTNIPVFPTFPTVIGNRNVESETLLAWEMGIRSAPTDDFYWDLAVFYNQYRDQQMIMAGTPGVDPISGVFALPLVFFNGQDAESYGFELASTWQICPDWSLRGAYSLLFIELDTSPLVFPPAVNGDGENPRNQLFLHSSWDVGCDWHFDMVGRYTDNLPGEGIKNYFELDARLAWRPSDAVEFSVVGRNLLDRAHPEFSTDTFTGVFATEVQREVYGMVTWRY